MIFCTMKHAEDRQAQRYTYEGSHLACVKEVCGC